MNSTQLRQTLWIVAAALVSFVAVRRWRLRTQLSTRTTTLDDAAIIVPLPGDGEALALDAAPLSDTDEAPTSTMPSVGDATTVPAIDELVALDDVPVIGEAALTGDDDDGDDERETDTRKVSSNRRITYRGRRYGPLPETLVGQRVHVEEVDGTLLASHDGQVVASFLLAQPQ